MVIVMFEAETVLRTAAPAMLVTGFCCRVRLHQYPPTAIANTATPTAGQIQDARRAGRDSLTTTCRRCSAKKITGVMRSTCSSDDTMPPSTGVASGLSTSLPARDVKKIGSSETTMVDVVMTFGRS